jgi:zinc transport system permease protein
MTLIYPFDSEFMIRALIAVAIIGLVAPMVGTFIVQRKLSLIGDGLGHVAAAGVGIALWLNFAPQGVAIVATIIAAIAIEWITQSSKSSDTALAIIFYSGIAASITFAGRSAKQSQLQSYLFGSVLSVTWDDIVLIGIVCTIVALVIFLSSKLLLAVAVDESSVAIAGVNIHVLRIILMCAVALIVSISMSITGLLLISAVMVIPVMTVRMGAQSFYRAWIFACVVGVVGSVAGLAMARMFDLAPGGTIVLTHVTLFLIANLISHLRRGDGDALSNAHLNVPQHTQPKP